MEQNQDFWRKCSSCKKPISFGQPYYICSVSTCNGDRTGYVFCAIICWDAHVPGARHRDAGALERKAPPKGGERRIVPAVTAPATPTKTSAPKDILIVASKLKDYIRITSEYNTSADVMSTLSDFVRIHCDRAIENAKADGRKTVMARDFKIN